MRERCKTLAGFIREAWHVIFPATPYVDNWHIDTICLPYETLVVTETGQQAIGAIVENRWVGRVLSYNHQTDKIEWRPVKNWMKSKSAPLLKIILVDGQELTLTANHPVFVKGSGYVRADRVKNGDRVLRLHELRDDASQVKRDKEHVLLQSMSLCPQAEGNERNQIGRMQLLRGHVLSLSRRVLQPALLWAGQNAARKTSVQDMRRGKISQQSWVPPMLCAAANHNYSTAVRSVWDVGEQKPGTVAGKFSEIWCLLRSRLLCTIYARAKQSCVSSRAQSGAISSDISTGAAIDCEAREWGLLSLLRSRSTARRSSHRQRQNKQRTVEFGGAMPSLPRSTEGRCGSRFQFSESNVLSVEPSLRLCDAVYNIEVEANNNYVADRILVHNCNHLKAITDGELLAAGLENRLLINIPPGTMKSLLVCVFWLAWEWGPQALPHLQAIATSYRLDFCRRDARRFRALVGSDWYKSLWPDIELTIQNEELIENSRGGKRESIPFGSLMGGRADRLYIDDPHSIDTAESDADRASTEIRFRERAILSLNNPERSAIVLVMQRLHQKDLSGIIIESKMPWLQLILPMRFEIERKCVTPFGGDIRTKDGELLFPDRFPRSVVDRDEAGMGAHATAGQFQQRPTPRGGLKFKRHNFPIDPVLPGGCRFVRGWDLAASDNRNSAYSCGVLVAHHKPTSHFYIVNVVRGRTENVEPMIKNTASQDKELYGDRMEISIPQDPGQAGKVQRKSLIGALVGYNAHSSPESGDKLTRAEPVIAQSEAGNISLLKGDWNEAFLDEIEMFPSGTFKDQVDALSRAFARFVMTPAEFVMPPIIVTKQRVAFGDHPGE